MDFYERVALVCKQIPYGKVATYGQVALLCGFPKNARQVGYALRSQKCGNVPAYRIVNHLGVLSGASAFDIPDLQRKQLEQEGVSVELLKNKVNLTTYGWKNSMEDAMNLRMMFENEKI